MSTTLDATTVGLFMLVVFPGLVSTTIYRLIMPARALDWGNTLLQGLFYSAINFVLGLPFLYWLVFGYDPLAHPVRYSSAAILLLLVTPVVWPLVLVWIFKSIFKSKRLARRIQIPYPTAWDFFFDQREPGFVLVHLSRSNTHTLSYSQCRKSKEFPMAKNNQSNDDKFEKGGYRPLNEGYSPKEHRGYTPRDQGGNLPKAPQGGTGESSRPSTPPGSAKTSGQ